MPSPKQPELVDIEIDVTWDDASNRCNPTFALGNKNGQKVKAWKQNNKFWTSFNNKPNAAQPGTPGFIIFFNIREQGTNFCQFLPDPHDAMWVRPSGLATPPCPTSEAHWGQFEAIDVVDHDANHRNKTLIVINKNDYQQMFAYTLRFEIEGCDHIVEFDPIGNNQNGDQ